MEIIKFIIAALLFLGALRGIKIGGWFILQAYETDRWAAMYKLGNYPSKRLAGYAVCSGLGTLLLAGAAGAIGFTVFT